MIAKLFLCPLGLLQLLGTFITRDFAKGAVDRRGEAGGIHTVGTGLFALLLLYLQSR